MSSPNSRRSVLETVAKRCPVLEALEDGPHHKRDLVEALECSRSTVDRAVRELESLELLERTNGTYRLTLAGKLALEEYRRSADVLGSVTEASDVLRSIPRDAPMCPCVFENAEIDYPEPHAPNEPLRRVAKQVTSEVDRFRGLSISERIPHFRHRLYEQTIEGDLDTEIVITEEVATFLLGNYPQQVQDVVTDGNIDFYTIESVPYGLILIETPTHSEMFLLIEGGHGVAVVRNRSKDAFEWADGIYRRYRAIGTKLEAP